VSNGTIGVWGRESTTVGVGSLVRLRSCGGENMVSIVGTSADEALYQLSRRMPLARALLGRSVGEEVRVRTGAGDVPYLIVAVWS
jgi:transcription elongation GreA/GreB family factor